MLLGFFSSLLFGCRDLCSLICWPILVLVLYFPYSVFIFLGVGRNGQIGFRRTDELLLPLSLSWSLSNQPWTPYVPSAMFFIDWKHF